MLAATSVPVVSTAQASAADNALSCAGRTPTIIAVPGVRTFGTAAADVIVGFPLLLQNNTLDGLGGDDVACGLSGPDRLTAAGATTACAATAATTACSARTGTTA